MEQKQNVMERVKMLPENFDGIVRFTNWSDEDFIGRWNSKDYEFKANTTSPLFIAEHSPLELLNIVKKFAKDLAEREWGKSEWTKNALKRERNSDGTPRGYGMSIASTYSIDQLAPLIQKGLYIYSESKAKVADALRPKLEDKLSRDTETGHLNTKAVKKGASMSDLAASFEKE
jgi:hypothetical protein